MKRPLLFGAMGLAALCANAQTTVETAQDLNIGANSCSQATATRATFYFKYTADCDQLLTIERNFMGSITPTTDGTSSTTIPYITSNNGTTETIPVKKGQTIYLIAQTEAMVINFTASFKEANVDGSSIATAIEATKEKFFVPQNREDNGMGGYNNMPTYIKYTATADDMLQMSFDGYVQDATIQEGEDGTPASLNFSSSYDNGVTTYSAKTPVEAGKTYYVSVKSYNPIYGSFEEKVIKQGSSYDVAIPAIEGENKISGEVGKTWYTITPSKAGFVNINISHLDMAGGSIKVYDQVYQITYNMPTTTVNGESTIRFEAKEGTTYYICVENAQSQTEEGYLNLELQEAKPGDTFNNPIVLPVDVDYESGYAVPKDNGTYYYSIEVPAGEHYITVNGPSRLATDDGSTQTAVYLYDKNSQGSYSLASGRQGFRQLVTTYAESTTYIIAWKCDEGTNDFVFDYSVTSVKEGDTPAKAIEIPEEALENETSFYIDDLSYDKYYKYTPTKSGWLTIDKNADPTIEVECWKDSYGTKYDVINTGMDSKAKVEAGQPVIIKIVGRGTTGDFSFSLSMGEFAQGESIDNPINVDNVGESTSVSLPTKAVDYWYCYTAPKSGKLTISSNMTAGMGNNALYAKNGVNGQLQNLKTSKALQGGASEDVYEGSMVVSEGDKIYVNVVLKDAQQNINLSFKMADPQPGETAATAIDLTNLDSYTLPAGVSRTAPIWLSIDAKEAGVYIIETPTYDPNDGEIHNTYIGADAYATDAQGNQIGSSVASASTNYDYTTNISQGVLKLVVNGTDKKTGRYLIQVYSTNGETPVNIIKRDIERGEDASMPIELEPGEFEMKAASYSDPIWYSVNAGTGDLSISAPNYWGGELYATDGDGMPTGSYLATAQSQYDASGYSYKLSYTIDGEQAKAGTYLIKVTQASSGNTATAEFKTDVTGIDQVAQGASLINTANGRIQGVNGEGIEVFDITGRVVAKGKGNVSVPKGVYVVRTNSGKTIKVTVK